MSLKGYLAQLRLQLARQLTHETDWSLTQIAEASGCGEGRQLRGGLPAARIELTERVASSSGMTVTTTS